ncbi:MAG TPA: helix-turn-helix domain-containing protein, partial [Rhodanobacteraceae bacterium]|nr:helix-turn-helix domain-containing protein [Rhodanobacteraceae bacterium]
GQRTGTKAETIRYYEKIGLIGAARRSTGNYRAYGPADVVRLGFVRRARELGFPLGQVRELLGLAGEREHDCCRVDALTREHLDGIDRKIADLSALRRELAAMLDACEGGPVANCRILEALSPTDVR